MSIDMGRRIVHWQTADLKRHQRDTNDNHQIMISVFLVELDCNPRKVRERETGCHWTG